MGVDELEGFLDALVYCPKDKQMYPYVGRLDARSREALLTLLQKDKTLTGPQKAMFQKIMIREATKKPKSRQIRSRSAPGRLVASTAPRRSGPACRCDKLGRFCEQCSYVRWSRQSSESGESSAEDACPCTRANGKSCSRCNPGLDRPCTPVHKRRLSAA